MPILDDAENGEVERLLDLFPVTHLRRSWTDLGTLPKKELCAGVAGERGRDEVATFLTQFFGCCKQHVYLFSHPDGRRPRLPTEVKNGERIVQDGRLSFYLARTTTEVVLTDPYEDDELSFLWPIKVENTADHTIVSIVTLVKDIQSYFPRRALVKRTGLSDVEILADIVREMHLEKLDIHRGVKALWHSGYMDCHYTKYRKARSSAYEIVDRNERRGIRENDPDLYAILRRARLSQSLFHMRDEEETSIRHFGTDPTEGTVWFRTYADEPGETGDVVRRILEAN